MRHAGRSTKRLPRRSPVRASARTPSRAVGQVGQAIESRRSARKSGGKTPSQEAKMGAKTRLKIRAGTAKPRASHTRPLLTRSASDGGVAIRLAPATLEVTHNPACRHSCEPPSRHQAASGTPSAPPTRTTDEAPSVDAGRMPRGAGPCGRSKRNPATSFRSAVPSFQG